MDNRSVLIFTGQVLLAITLIIITFFVTSTLKQVKFGQGTIYVKGCAERQIESDFVKWQGGIMTIAKTQVQAYEKLEKDLEIIRKYMQEKGISLDEVVFSPISTSLNYQRNEQGHSLNTVDSYELSQSFSVSSSNILQITKVSQNITTLIKDGLSINSYQPQYFYSKLDGLKINMLGEAARDALQRAEELVSKSGSRVGVLRSAQQGVFQITPAFSTSVSDYGEFDTSSVSKRIKAVVTMEYTID